MVIGSCVCLFLSLKLQLLRFHNSTYLGNCGFKKWVEQYRSHAGASERIGRRGSKSASGQRQAINTVAL